MFVVGVTGGIGSGKTAVTDHLASLGICVVDADIVAREVVQPNQPALKNIAEHFGDEILLPDGNLDRSGLRKIIFENPSEKEWLEELLHPLIRSEIIQQLKNASSDYAVLVSPLLVETKQSTLTHRILVVDAPEAIQLKRASQRDGVSEQQIKSIIKVQAPREKRNSFADDIIVNNKDLAHLENETNKLHKFYLQLAQEKRA